MAKEYELVVNNFLDRISALRPSISSMYLFGSHARGTARPDSDYDILIVAPKKNKELKSKLYDAVMDIELEKGADISLKVLKQDQFDRLREFNTPFIKNVLKEGIKIA
ncbi:nucleotidyltransferase domain-containing protein [Candidatus Saganbacteria bacterium]|nr:nucleotidyltransferase domain-containing protein [Candidatus Saganbacteria bacterium]